PPPSTSPLLPTHCYPPNLARKSASTLAANRANVAQTERESRMRKRPKVQRRRIDIHTLLILAVVTSALPALAQRPTSAQASALRQACRADYESVCAGVPTGGAAALECLQKNAARTSAGCQQALRAISGSASPPAPAAATAQTRATGPAMAPATAPATVDRWPHAVTGENGSALVYQPQVI